MRLNAKMLPVALLFAVSLGGCVSTPPYDQSNARAIDDATITANVKAALVQDPATRSRNISVNTLNGTVELSGFVDSGGERHEAERVAASIAGVRLVQNQLQINGAAAAQPYPYTSGVVVARVSDDQTISSQVRSALSANPVTATPQIRVATADGVVQLAGFVDSNEQRDTAGSIARSVVGVRRVDNDLHLRD
jgi:hyperosmotically inducible periplasmic protein